MTLDRFSRRTFLQLSGVAVFRARDLLSSEKTAGPFPIEEQFDRRDITDGLPGHPVRMVSTRPQCRRAAPTVPARAMQAREIRRPTAVRRAAISVLFSPENGRKTSVPHLRREGCGRAVAYREER